LRAGPVSTIQESESQPTAGVEEIAYRMGCIDAEQLERLAGEMLKNDYGQYGLEVLRG